MKKSKKSREPLSQEFKDKFREVTGYTIVDDFGDIIEKDGKKFAQHFDKYDFMHLSFDGTELIRDLSTGELVYMDEKREERYQQKILSMA